MNSCFSEIDPDIIDWNDYTGHEQFNAVYTITIGELVSCGVFDWNMPELDWKSAAFDDEQYERVCNYFIERFYYREISLEPFAEWARMLKSKIVYELMPKYRFQYSERLREWSIASGGREYGNSTLKSDTTNSGNSKTDNYYKSRNVNSKYPQTQLSGNSDYLTDGNDQEDERVIDETASGNATKNDTSSYEKNKDVNTIDYIESLGTYSEFMGSIDKRLCDELESFFVCMYTANVNAVW